MKALNILFLILLSICSTSLTRMKLQNKPCTGLGLDCDASHICCSGYHCVNDRCQEADEDDTLEYSRFKGGRCDSFHGCNDGLRCESHRCISLDPDNRAKMVELGKKLLEEENGLYGKM